MRAKLRHWVVAALGALCAGAVLVPINTRFTAAETQDVLHTQCRARALIVEGEFLGRDRLAELSEVPPDRRAITGGVGRPRRRASRPVIRTILCDVLFTSGTTGRSKGAMSAHRQSLGVAEAWAVVR